MTTPTCENCGQPAILIFKTTNKQGFFCGACGGHLIFLADERGRRDYEVEYIGDVVKDKKQ